jgi:hypothetical protein
MNAYFLNFNRDLQFNNKSTNHNNKHIYRLQIVLVCNFNQTFSRSYTQININRYDLDETFSPPSHDSFFYVRYPKTDTSSQQLREPNFRQASEPPEISERLSKQDFSQHTQQCRQFIPMDSSAPGEW